MGRRCRGGEQAGLAPTWAAFESAEAAQRSRGPQPHTSPQSRVPELGKEVPTGNKNYRLVKTSVDWGSVTQRLLETQLFLFKGWLRLPLNSSTRARLWGTQTHTRRNWIVWHQGRNSGAAFSQMEVLAGIIVPVLGPPWLQD
uniref:Uncharacterized protein n=1 Tax=Myotis myotis TaxID=51298 RepID=A0A7J7UCV2_MYOMY|nr:hypothetical protein mMyoMyo1_008758 [Myotis myotis]